MQFFYNPEPIDKKISEIKKYFKKSMNGEVSHTMSSMGANYKVNYGIEYLRIKQISAHYQPNKDLAERLWNLNIREAMILATLLYPIDSFSKQTAEDWATQINQPELVEYFTMNILAKVEFANPLIIEWIISDNDWKKITAFTLSARTYKKLTDKEIEKIILEIEKQATTDNFHLYKSMALSLSRMCRIDKSTTERIKNLIETFKHSQEKSKQYIATTVETEISFS